MVAVTEAEISATKGDIVDWGIAGLGIVGGQNCVVSAHIYKKHSKTQEALLRRLGDLAVHEFGHTLGFTHCEEKGCVMADAKGKAISSADASSGRYCAKCLGTLPAEEREKIRSDLAALFMKTFGEELEKGGYKVVDAAAPDVLRVIPKLEDVYVNAPDLMAPGRTRTYVMNAGRMSLLAELRDSETGAIIARVSDQSEARDLPYFELATSVSNSVEARRMIADWARILRARLDSVRMRAEADQPMSQ